MNKQRETLLTVGWGINRKKWYEEHGHDIFNTCECPDTLETDINQITEILNRASDNA
jgi:hypothetical protein|tara:strand:+ start:223 stop:393 length:171 start_codon:yes stop_codon:yes gene_type:complete